MINLESNALRGDYMKSIVLPTIKEIHDDISTVFGPGASDAFITKNKQPYYTRDGLEVLESLYFNNELSEHIRKIIYQAAHRQGKVVGDGTTTLIMFYTNLYMAITNYMKDGPDKFKRAAGQMGSFREIWNRVTGEINEMIRARSNPMTDERLLSMLYTCTQDHELSARIYDKLASAIMNQAYITIEKSNIETDFSMETFTDPLIKATRQFSIFPVAENEPNTVILHCNGMLDIAHEDIVYSLMGIEVQTGETRIPLNIVILCNGVNDTTRKVLKSASAKIAANGSFSKGTVNNIAVYTLDNYRGMTPDMLEDISTIITDEEGIGGLVNSLTFESLLYQSLQSFVRIPDIPELATFDCDLHHIEKLKEIILNYGLVQFDDVEGIRIKKPLGPVATKRYNDLKESIRTEKSGTKKLECGDRLRNSFGQFIAVEVGSKLIKDSQRKYELILDGIMSAMDGAREGILVGNSIIIAIQECVKYNKKYKNFESLSGSEYIEATCSEILIQALALTLIDMGHNVFPDEHVDGAYLENIIQICSESETEILFNLKKSVDSFVSALTENESVAYEVAVLKSEDPDVADRTLSIDTSIVEPTGIITSILENSTTAMELALSKTFHVNAFMGNNIA